MGPHSAVPLAGIEIGGIGVGCKDHGAGLVEDAIVWICGTVIEKMVDLVIGSFSGGGLLPDNFAESMKEFVVH